MNPFLLKKLFPNASQATLRRNAGDLGAVEAHRPQRPALQALDRGLQEPKSRQGCVEVCIECIAMRHRLLDDHDATAYACKPLTDAIAASLGIDDGDKRLKWLYHQVPTRGPEGTIVVISATI